VQSIDVTIKEGKLYGNPVIAASHIHRNINKLQFANTEIIEKAFTAMSRDIPYLAQLNFFYCNLKKCDGDNK
jgi:hypothetical protein